jgi:predicted ATPase with chaperone activity
MRPTDMGLYSKLVDAGISLIQTTMSQLSARGFHRVRKLERPIADFADFKTIQPAQLAEALQYQPK